ncbi:MAG: ATP-binding protein, partial [Desulfobacterales bacterium]|nr:ATP-binding protein [Desulfobacterales bacterium]
RRRLGVRYSLPASPVMAAVDRRQMVRVLRNLAQNATRYCPAAGQIDVALYEADHQVRLDIANPAPELLERDLPYIFERFYRGEKSRSREHGGAGIGLAIVKELVDAHGGRVEARLEEERICIRLTLPREAA